MIRLGNSRHTRVHRGFPVEVNPQTILGVLQVVKGGRSDEEKETGTRVVTVVGCVDLIIGTFRRE